MILMSLIFTSLAFSCQSLPEWIFSPSGTEEYFVGVGNSNVGNKNIDYDMALEKARYELAKSISVSISGETENNSYSVGNGYSYDTSFEKIQEEVNLDLSLIETVDSYYSKKDGWWFLVRLSKERWYASLSDQENQLAEKIESLLITDATLLEQYTKLVLALELLVHSSYQERLRVNYNGREEKAYSLITSLLSSTNQDLNFRLSLQTNEAIKGENIKIKINVNSGYSSFPRSFFIPIIIRHGDYILANTKIEFNSKGERILSLPTSSLLSGNNRLDFFVGNYPLDETFLTTLNLNLAPLVLQKRVDFHSLGEFTTFENSIEEYFPEGIQLSEYNSSQVLYYDYKIDYLPPVGWGKPHYATAMISLIYIDNESGRQEHILQLTTSRLGAKNKDELTRVIDTRLLQEFKRAYPSTQNFSQRILEVVTK